MDRGLWCARLLLGAVILTELLGLINIIPLTPEFTWKGLLLQSIGVLAIFEILAWYLRYKKINYVVGNTALAAALLVTFDAAGDLMHWYGGFFWYDQVMHALGGFVAGLTVTSLIAAYRKHKYGLEKKVRGEIFVGGITAAATLGVIYELIEYYEDLLTGSHRLGDGFDTAQDLSLDLYGGILAAWLVVSLPKLRFQR